METPRVKLGSVIEIQLDEEPPRRIEIRKGESDPLKGIISSETAVAKAILGTQEGQERTFRVRNVTRRIRVLKILS